MPFVPELADVLVGRVREAARADLGGHLLR
jgi:hypothetical protein